MLYSSLLARFLGQMCFDILERRINSVMAAFEPLDVFSKSRRKFCNQIYPEHQEYDSLEKWEEQTNNAESR
jgi:hypothetical protein